MLAINLACVGTTTKVTDGVINTQPAQMVVRIDVAAQRWCAGQCKETTGFAKIDDRLLTLIDQTEPPVVTYFTINRESGSYYWFQTLGHGTTVTKAECEVRPFTGFPARKF